MQVDSLLFGALGARRSNPDVASIDRRLAPWKLDARIEVRSWSERISASVHDVLENLVDMDHFSWVHATAGPPRLESLEFDDVGFSVSSSHEVRLGESLRQAVISVACIGTGMTVARFDSIVSLTVVGGLTPVTAHETISTTCIKAEPRTARGFRGPVLAALADGLYDQFCQDAEIWAHRRYLAAPLLKRTDPIAAYRRWFRQRHQSAPLDSRAEDSPIPSEV